MIISVNLLGVILTVSFIEKVESFESLLDSDYYTINWKGPLPVSDEYLKQDSIVMRTTNNEQYKCLIPVVNSGTSSKGGEDFSSAKLELEFLRSIINSDVCTYRLEAYWTYELCHGKHIRQYHEERDLGKLALVQDYYLGRYNREKFNSELKKAKQDRDEGVVKPLPKTKKVQGQVMPYYEVIFDEGTTCDLTGQPRRSHLQFVCSEDGRGEIYSLKETSSCEYEVVLLTNLLCQHPNYGPKRDPIHSIDCHSLTNAPRRPLDLEVFELENSIGHYESKKNQLVDSLLDVVQALADVEEEIVKESASLEKDLDETLQQGNHPATRFEDPIPTVNPSSRQILIDFFNGDYCIEGGSGWWKHEFCYGRHVRQFHEDPKGRTEIVLGLWNEENHLEWLVKNPSKRPKPVHERKHIHNFYGGGSFCHEMGKSRFVEVRFDCLKKTESSNAISLFLVENVTCEYKLIVEASLFCDIILAADDDGIINFKT